MDLPIYKKLQEKLKQQIREGKYKDGDLLPSENELSATYKVTRATIRQALEELVKQNYIVKEKGRGSKVSWQRKSLGLLSVKGFSQIVAGAKQHVSTSILLGPELRPWESGFFFPLTDLELAASSIYVKRIRCVEEYPVMLEHTYIPNYNVEGFCENPFVNGSLFETLSSVFGIEITNIQQECRAILAPDEITSDLKITKNTPILHLFLKFQTNVAGFHIYSSLLCNTESYSIGNIY